MGSWCYGAKPMTMRVDVVLPMFTGDPSDVVVNTWHFETTLTKEQFATNVDIHLGEFYRTVYGTAAQRVSYIDWTMVKGRVFDLTEPTPRVPVESANFFPNSPGTETTDVPTEVAAVASFQSGGQPGDVYQRRYNRVFLGAVPPTWMAPSTASSFPTLSSALLTNVTGAMKALQASANGPVDIWVQISRAGGSIRTLPVTGGWMDNSPDTQRRRSVDSTQRVNWAPDE